MECRMTAAIKCDINVVSRAGTFGAEQDIITDTNGGNISCQSLIFLCWLLYSIGGVGLFSLYVLDHVIFLKEYGTFILPIHWLTECFLQHKLEKGELYVTEIKW
jgi:hypothetical protein